ncbi:MAG: type II toxin-antitoxin system Phd/YefM family antitoxin [Burkholderiales bacterium]|jgi:prevent-host-death family protein|nr:type II toxin-antitoxin system Phd/YefM family antitoxin [Burkholderiales bacterium]
MMVTSTDFKMNLGRYLDLAAHEEIVITKNGRRIARLVADKEDLTAVARSLFGIIAPDGASGEAVKEERMRDADGQLADRQQLHSIFTAGRRRRPPGIE